MSSSLRLLKQLGVAFTAISSGAMRKPEERVDNLTHTRADRLSSDALFVTREFDSIYAPLPGEGNIFYEIPARAQCLKLNAVAPVLPGARAVASDIAGEVLLHFWASNLT